MATNTDCLYTTVHNISGKEAVFSFLPPHGKKLAANEQLTVAGNIIDRLAAKTSKRQFQALERALMGTPLPSPAVGWLHPPSLAIISTPAVFVMTNPGQPYIPDVPGPGQPFIPATGQMLTAPAGVLGTTDTACWGAINVAGLEADEQDAEDDEEDEEKSPKALERATR